MLGSLATSGGVGTSVPAGQQTTLGIIEFQDAMNALQRDIGKAAIFCQRFGIVPAARRDRAAVAVEHRRDFTIGNAGRALTLIRDASTQPEPSIGNRQKIAAVGRDADRGQPAELFVGRRQFEARRERSASRIVSWPAHADRRLRSAWRGYQFWWAQAAGWRRRPCA